MTYESRHTVRRANLLHFGCVKQLPLGTQDSTWVPGDDEPVELRLWVLVTDADAVLVHIHVWEFRTVPAQAAQLETLCTSSSFCCSAAQLPPCWCGQISGIRMYTTYLSGVIA